MAFNHSIVTVAMYTSFSYAKVAKYYIQHIFHINVPRYFPNRLCGISKFLSTTHQVTPQLHAAVSREPLIALYFFSLGAVP